MCLSHLTAHLNLDQPHMAGGHYTGQHCSGRLAEDWISASQTFGSRLDEWIFILFIYFFNFHFKRDRVKMSGCHWCTACIQTLVDGSGKDSVLSWQFCQSSGQCFCFLGNSSVLPFIPLVLPEVGVGGPPCPSYFMKRSEVSCLVLTSHF